MTVLVGCHVTILTKDPVADRRFFQEVFGLPSVDAGHGYLLFGLPPTSIGFHSLADEASEAKSSSDSNEDTTSSADQNEVNSKEDNKNNHSRPDGSHTMMLTVKDMNTFIAQMKEHNVGCDEPEDAGWGITTKFRLPGGSLLSAYEPRHPAIPHPEIDQKRNSSEVADDEDGPTKRMKP